MLCQSSKKIQILLDWCAENAITIDGRLRVDADGRGGIGVFSTDVIVHPGTTLVKIPKESVLSVRTCALAGEIPNIPHGIGAQLALSLALYVEILQGHRSRWHGYVQSLPHGIVDLPLFWQQSCETENDDGLVALLWLKGTEVAKIIDSNVERRTRLDTLNHFYNGTADPLLQRHHNLWCAGAAPTLSGFHRSFSLVSSRAFLVDSYHGLSMVPIADAFNHVQENHVHLESDYNVCPQCGSLDECPHDHEVPEHPEASSDPPSPMRKRGNHDTFYEMVSASSVPAHTEVFNTYGEELTNAQLLNQYGFILDINDNDRLSWSVEEVLHALAPDQGQADFAVALQQILDVIPEEHTLFTHSELLYWNILSRDECCVNDEGKISHQLWILLYLAGLQKLGDGEKSHNAIPLLSDVLDAQLHVEEINHKETEVWDPQGFPPIVWGVLKEISRSVILLCHDRKRVSGRIELGWEDLSSLLDDVPTEMTRTRMAISLLMSERSILDCCEASWREVMECITSTSSPL